MKKQTFVFYTFFAFLLSGCAQIQPFIQDVNIISIEQENELGAAMAEQVLKEMPLVRDSRLNNPVQQIGQRLVAALPNKQFDFKFYVVDNAQPNAFNIPGGHVFIHSGLMNFVSNQDELAGVMAHELGHAVERHTTKSLSRQYGLSSIIGRLMGERETNMIQQMVLGITSQGILSRYGRSDESEADVIGYQLLRKAGYHKDGLLNFLIKLEQASGGRSGPSFLSSHPPTPERITALQNLQRSQA